MKKLTLLQTPLHAATNIRQVLREVRENKMPVDDNKDPKALPPEVKKELLENGEAFQAAIKKADDWERANAQHRANSQARTNGQTRTAAATN
jgi:hypothetical protein